MSGQLPAQIDPIRLADEGARLRGVLLGSSMPRLRELTLSADRPVAVELQFERTAQGVRRMRGTIRTQVDMTCRRCQKPLKIEIVAQPLFMLLQSGEAEPEEGETLIVEGPLSLPMIPGHAEGECELAFPMTTDKVSESKKKTNPFAELRGFKGKNQDQ
jgi:uncharacterized protein